VAGELPNYLCVGGGLVLSGVALRFIFIIRCSAKKNTISGAKALIISESERGAEAPLYRSW